MSRPSSEPLIYRRGEPALRVLQEKHNFDLPAATLLNSLSCYTVHSFSLFSFASVFHRRPSLTGPSDGLTRRIPHPSQMVISIGPRTMGSCCFLLLGDSVYYFISLFSRHLLLDSDSVFLPYFRISLYLSLPFLSPPLCPLSLPPSIILHLSTFSGCYALSLPFHLLSGSFFR